MTFHQSIKLAEFNRTRLSLSPANSCKPCRTVLYLVACLTVLPRSSLTNVNSLPYPQSKNPSQRPLDETDGLREIQQMSGSLCRPRDGTVLPGTDKAWCAHEYTCTRGSQDTADTRLHKAPSSRQIWRPSCSRSGLKRNTVMLPSCRGL